MVARTTLAALPLLAVWGVLNCAGGCAGGCWTGAGSTGGCSTGFGSDGLGSAAAGGRGVSRARFGLVAGAVAFGALGRSLTGSGGGSGPGSMTRGGGAG